MKVRQDSKGQDFIRGRMRDDRRDRFDDQLQIFVVLHWKLEAEERRRVSDGHGRTTRSIVPFRSFRFADVQVDVGEETRFEELKKMSRRGGRKDVVGQFDDVWGKQRRERKMMKRNLI